MLFSMFHETLMVLIVKFPPFVVIHQPAFNITMMIWFPNGCPQSSLGTMNSKKMETILG